MRSSAILVAILLAPVCTTVARSEIVRSPEAWSVTPPFVKNDEARDEGLAP